jgi:hypothetical protein
MMGELVVLRLSISTEDRMAPAAVTEAVENTFVVFSFGEWVTPCILIIEPELLIEWDS